MYVASAALMLVCQGAMLIRQHSLAMGMPLPLIDALRRAVFRLPTHGTTALIVVLPLALSMALAPVEGVASLVLLPVGLALLVWQAFAWPAAVLDGAMPIEALRIGARVARGRWRELLGLVATAYAGVLVFVLLAGIGVGIVMGIAGMSPNPGGLMVGFSRILLAAVIAVPVVWLGAVWTTAYLAVRAAQP